MYATVPKHDDVSQHPSFTVYHPVVAAVCTIAEHVLEVPAGHANEFWTVEP